MLREEGYRVVLVNSNPATIMTDPEFADATYIEPLDVATVARIIEKERPDALLPTLGGQTGLNLAIALHEAGVLDTYNVEMIGANVEAIRTAEDRQRFKLAMTEIGLTVPPSGIAYSIDEALRVGDEVSYPVIVRPAFILGGGGTGIAHDRHDLKRLAERGLAASPISEILIERSIAGWKEYELEVMRDHADNVVVICSIENLDPMGVHTGESITVAPAQTLTDVEYQLMRDAAFACIRRIGVETGGSNVQFAVNPQTGEMVIIEMNPRVSRSSALASKATGFPIAKIAAKLAVGYRLDEIRNDITRETPASFEPAIDYVVTKFPRWAFEKLPGSNPVLGTQMQSVGEVMAIGRTFCESLQKAVRSLETGRLGVNCDPAERELDALSDEELALATAVPTPDRIFQLEAALRRFVSIERLQEVTGIDPWFLDQILQIVEERDHLGQLGLEHATRADWRRAKRLGFSDGQLAYLWNADEAAVREQRLAAGVRVTYKTVDTCAAEFAAYTPYHYSTYEDEDEIAPLDKPAVVILGSGPNRIGQGVEFDYCCVHAAFALRDAGYETVMVNCNPETVSTDYDTSDRLFFEPLTNEDVLNVCERLKERGDVRGVIVSLGGQTPLKLAHGLERSGIPVLGTTPASIDAAEDREQFNALCDRLDIPQPDGAIATNADDAVAVANAIGYPVLVRPSYVLGGRAMQIVYDDTDVRRAMAELAHTGSLGREGGLSAQRPALDRPLLGRRDGGRCRRGARPDRRVCHRRGHGAHRGSRGALRRLRVRDPSAHTVGRGRAHDRAVHACAGRRARSRRPPQRPVRGEGPARVRDRGQPAASRTVPFVSKATGVPLAKVAARVMLGATLDELTAEGLLRPSAIGRHVAVKEAVLPFNRFPEVDTILGPEMRSTGEVMGIDRTFGMAFAKSQAGAGNKLPDKGTVFLSLADRDKDGGIVAARRFFGLGFSIAATAGTARLLEDNGVRVDTMVAKVGEDIGVDAVDLISSGKVDLVINTPRGRGPRTDGMHIRRAAIVHGVACITTVAAALAAAAGIEEEAQRDAEVRSLQEYHADGQLRLEV